MTQDQPVAVVDDGSGNPVDRHNLRTAAWGGLIGTALEQYDFVIYGTATAIVFTRIFFPNTAPGVGSIWVRPVSTRNVRRADSSAMATASGASQRRTDQTNG